MSHKLSSIAIRFSNMYIVNKVELQTQNNLSEDFIPVSKKKNCTDNPKKAHYKFRRFYFFCTFCPSRCCQMISIKHKPYRGVWPKRENTKRAGVLVLDPSRKFVLLVQSCGKLWGAAKGVMEPEETPEKAAIRELKEETGIMAEPEQFLNKIKIACDLYYILIHPKEDLKVPKKSKEYNDASGLGWVSLECLRKNFNYFKELLNLHARILIYKSLNICGVTPIEMLPQNKIEKFNLK